MPTSSPKKNQKEFSRVLSLFFSGLICLLVSIVVGMSAWLMFGSGQKPENRRKMNDYFSVKITNKLTHEAELSNKTPVTQNTSSINSEPVKVNQIEPVKDENPEYLISDTGLKLLYISEGESIIGGEGTQIPLTRKFVKPFFINETEVTNEEYSHFIKEIGYAKPNYWKSNDLPDSTKLIPVVNVSFNDAGTFCGWLGKKFDAQGRLPDEFEWEYAARGSKHQKYSWGNEPNQNFVAYSQPPGVLKPVKFYAQNISPFGVYDMAGSVWEWTTTIPSSEEFKTNNKINKSALAGKNLRILKGSSSNEKLEAIFPAQREFVPNDIRDLSIGFRCVVVKNQ